LYSSPPCTKSVREETELGPETTDSHRGSESTGFVTDVMKSNDKIIWATVNGARSVIDMTKISKWKYKIINPVSYMMDKG